MACESKCGKATGYAVLSIRTAWLSYYHPLEFITALLNSTINNNDKLEHYIAKIKLDGFNILGPDVNKSKELFSVSYDENAIRFGLRGIKGLGKSSVTVIGARGDKEFSSLTDFTERLNAYFKCDKKVLEDIAKCGGFESIEPNRKAIVSSAEMIVNSLKKNNSKNIAGQISLFDAFSDDEALSNASNLKLLDVEDYTKDEKLKFEKDLLSFYISGHPLDKYDDIIKNSKEITFLSDIKMALNSKSDDFEDVNFDNSEDMRIDNITVLVRIVKIKDMLTKKGDTMSKLIIEDKSGSINCTVFPKTRTAYRTKLVEDNIVAISGSAVNDDYGLQIIASDISSPQILSSSEKPSNLILVSPFSKTGPERTRAINLFRSFKNSVDSFEGAGDIEALFVVDGEMFNLGKVPSDISVLMKFKSVFGEDKIKFKL